MAFWKRIAPVALGAAIVVAARAQAPAAPSTDDAAKVEYETVFEPFDDNTFARLQMPPALPPPAPLFEPYDPLKGMEAHTATSRLVNPDRAIFTLPVLNAKVGDEIRVPFYQDSGPALTAHVLWLVFDPAVVEAVDARPEAWTGSDLTVNATPDDAPVQHGINTAQTAGTPYAGKGALMSVRFKVVGAGESSIEVSQFSASDPAFNTIRSVVRNGLVRAAK
ncbi:MAG TPA: cohesin domain-containing protein [Armatimonadota bacterium]|jgi:hypothetical protein